MDRGSRFRVGWDLRQWMCTRLGQDKDKQQTRSEHNLIQHKSRESKTPPSPPFTPQNTLEYHLESKALGFVGENKRLQY